jgi:hypothetical protein
MRRDSLPNWKPKRRKAAWIILPLAAAGAVVLLLGWILGWFEKPSPALQISTPGAAEGPASRFYLDPLSVDDLQSQVKKLLTGAGQNGLASWYRPANRTGIPPAARSGLYLAADQLRYGQFVLEQGERQEFLNWWQSFSQVYIVADGSVRSSTGETGPADQFPDWRVNSQAMRLLAQSCSLWPDNKRLAALRRLSDRMIRLASQSGPADFLALVPTPAPVPDPAATPTPKPAVTAQPEKPALPLKVLRLASLDLFAMQQMTQVDPRWQDLSARYLQIVDGGYIGDALPLYGLAYDPAQNGYLPFDGDIPVIDAEEALLTILHLTEIGQENPRSLSWIRDQIYNQKAIYKAYHVTQGQPAEKIECVEAYAIVARIARIKEDRELYDAALALLLWHQATGSKSEVKSAIYSQDKDGLIEIWASDNTWALLAAA